MLSKLVHRSTHVRNVQFWKDVYQNVVFKISCGCTPLQHPFLLRFCSYLGVIKVPMYFLVCVYVPRTSYSVKLLISKILIISVVFIILVLVCYFLNSLITSSRFTTRKSTTTCECLTCLFLQLFLYLSQYPRQFANILYAVSGFFSK